MTPNRMVFEIDDFSGHVYETQQTHTVTMERRLELGVATFSFLL